MDSKKKILIIDDEQSMIAFLLVMFEKEGFEVFSTTDGNEALEICKNEMPEIILCDVKMDSINGFEILEKVKQINSKIQVIMMTAYGSIEMAVQAMKKGAYDFVIKPFKLDQIRLVVNNVCEKIDLIEENKALKEGVSRQYEWGEIIGKSLGMNDIFEQVKKLSLFKTNVLITGESGTGKELIAKAIHANSICKNNRFVAINCSSLPAALLESELFGHVKGAFSGAIKDKEGLFETANNGTFLFDEIGEMPFDLQTKLLRVLQEKEIRRLGGNKSIPVEVRVIASTNQDIKKAIKEGKFREDLYYRLSVINIHILPLRERMEDLPLIVSHFIEKFQVDDEYVEVSKQVMHCFNNYSWPGNVRELENVIERAIVLKKGSMITIDDIPEYFYKKDTENYLEINLDLNLKDRLELFEKEIIKQGLVNCNGNQFKTARNLGLSRQSLHYKLQKYGLS